jgi:hypothetical protein
MDGAHVALCKKLLTSNPVFRIGNLNGGIEDIIKDPFFSTLNWNDLNNQTMLPPYKPG